MRLLLLAGASMLAFSSPALARQDTLKTAGPAAVGTVDTQPSESVLDTPIGEGEQPAAEAAPTGNPVLDRLNALEARIRQLEGRNAELEQQAELNEERLETVETRAAKAAQFSWGPTIS